MDPAHLAALAEILARYARGEPVADALRALAGAMDARPEPSPAPSPREAPEATQEAAEAPREVAARVFAYWQTRTGRARARMTPERATKILARLRQGYSEDDLRAAIDGCVASPFHSGENAQGTVYDDLDLILRNGSTVERFAGMARGRVRAAAATPATKADERKASMMAEADAALREGRTSDYNRIIRAIRTGAAG